MSVEVKFDRFPQIIQAINDEGKKLVDDTAETIKQEVRAQWSGYSRLMRGYEGIRTRKGRDERLSVKGRYMREVVAGSKARFWAPFIEYGTQDQAANPAMTPAAERNRARFVSSARAVLRRVR